MIGETVIVRHHAHINACHYCESRCFFLIRSDAPRRDEFLDVFPVRDDVAFESEFSTQNVGQDVTIDVSGNAVDLSELIMIVRTGFYCCIEGGQKIFRADNSQESMPCGDLCR